MGNPTSYRGKAMTWRGKQLTGIADGTDTIAYSYDENGLRLQKTVNGTNTNYYYNGSVLIGLTKGTDTLRFSYDAAGNAAAVDHNGTYYYYLRNGQGDIVKIVDGSGATVVEYSYDSWGKQLSCTGTLEATLGVLNPFRYRGYVYDEETQWYYLKSRYYDPETCRFVSADVLLSTGQGVIGHNCYAYCLNHSVNSLDSEGLDAIWIQEGHSASEQGHSGLMVQDENGDWFYFYWGPESESFTWKLLFPGDSCDAYVVKIEETDEDLSTTQGVIAALFACKDRKVQSRADKITSTYYFKGDYTETYNTINRFKQEATNGVKYNLAIDNCVERTLRAFYASDSRFAYVYKGGISDASPNLVASRVALLPSDKNEFPFWLRVLLQQ